MKKIIIIVTAMLLIFSCKQPEEKAKMKYQEELQQVLDKHDTIMTNMSKINHLIKTLESQNVPVEDNIEAQKTIDKLKAIHKSMFDWMHDFDKEFPDIHEKDKSLSQDEFKEQTEALKAQDKKLTKMKEDFEETIRKAEALTTEN